MALTWLTSLAFLIPARCCGAGVGGWKAAWFPALACTSFLHHALYRRRYPGKALVAWADRTLAHAIAARTAIDAARLDQGGVMLAAYWAGLAWVGGMYYAVLVRRRGGGVCSPLHESIHIAATLGTLALCRAERSGASQ